MEKGFECTQCGSTKFDDLDKERIRCSFCGSIYPVFSNEPSIIIRKGANVIFGKNSKVELKGSVEIQEGAKVEIRGQMTSGTSKKKQEFTTKKADHSKSEKKRE
jgi:hypothetical protein